MSATETRRALLRAMTGGEFNESLRWLNAQGLVIFILTADSIEFRVTPRGKLWLQGAEAFHPSEPVA